MEVFWVKILNTSEDIKKHIWYNRKVFGLHFSTFEMLICSFTSLHTIKLVDIKLHDCFIRAIPKISEHLKGLK